MTHFRFNNPQYHLVFFCSYAPHNVESSTKLLSYCTKSFCLVSQRSSTTTEGSSPLSPFPFSFHCTTSVLVSTILKGYLIHEQEVFSKNYIKLKQNLSVLFQCCMFFCLFIDIYFPFNIAYLSGLIYFVMNLIG